MADLTDADMMEADAPSHQQAHSGDGGVKGLLAAARQLVDQGKPSEALQAVVTAMRTKGGHGAVVRILQQARELYRTRIQDKSAVDQLASLFAECAIVEAHPLIDEPWSSAATTISTERDASENNSILAETGREQIVLDAFADGSSFICLKCGGLVSNHRKDNHYAYWCD